MVGRREHSRGRDDAPSPDEGPDIPAPMWAHDYDFLLQMIYGVQKASAIMAHEIKGLSSIIEKQGQKLDKIDDVRVELGKLQTEIVHLSAELKSTKDKLEKVRNWVIGAAAIVGAIVVLAPIAARIIPPAAAPAAPTMPSSAPTQSTLPPVAPPTVVNGKSG